jgi:hypothetical protein
VCVHEGFGELLFLKPGSEFDKVVFDNGGEAGSRLSTEVPFEEGLHGNRTGEMAVGHRTNV